MNTKMVEGTPVREHTLKMMAYFSYAQIHGADIDGETQIDMILGSLPNNFNQFWLNYNIEKMFVSLSELMKELQDEETTFKPQ